VTSSCASRTCSKIWRANLRLLLGLQRPGTHSHGPRASAFDALRTFPRIRSCEVSDLPDGHILEASVGRAPNSCISAPVQDGSSFWGLSGLRRLRSFRVRRSDSLACSPHNKAPPTIAPAARSQPRTEHGGRTGFSVNDPGSGASMAPYFRLACADSPPGGEPAHSTSRARTKRDIVEAADCPLGRNYWWPPDYLPAVYRAHGLGTAQNVHIRAGIEPLGDSQGCDPRQALRQSLGRDRANATSHQ
jgi:hypothetical protein